MELTTEKLIYILPIDEDIRQDLLARWQTMDPDEKFKVERILWGSYYELFRIKLDNKLEKALEDLHEEGSSIEFSPDFYKKLHAETEKEMQMESHTTADETELGSVRSKLEELMSSHAVN